MTGMEPLLLGASLAGTAMQAMGTIAAGNTAAAQGAAMQQAQEYKAKQMDQQAGQERAASQRNAIEARRRGRFAASRGLALAAASGGGAADPSVVNVMAGLGEDAEYRALMEIYGGEEKARGLEHGGDLSRYEGQMAYAAGKAKQKNARMQAFGQVVSGFGKAGMQGAQMGMFDKFNPMSGYTTPSGNYYPDQYGP